MLRALFLFFAAGVALLGGLTTLASTLQTRDYALRGVEDPARTVALPYRVPRLGVNAELTQYAPDTLDTHLAQMRAAEITWVRQFVPWDVVEPTEGDYQWATWDRIIAPFADDPQLRFVAVLVNSPTWARPDNAQANPATPPTNPESFAAFAGAFAERYGPVIDHYQIWDEPNLNAMWGGRDPRPVEYLALLRAAHAAIHVHDPDATVIAAALAPTTETGPRNLSDWRFLDALYTFGGGAVMDAVAAKPYGFDSGPSDREVDEDTLNFSRFVALREIMVAHGDASKALWASHWGWNSLPGDWAGDPSIWGQVSPDAQTAYTLEGLARAEREWPWLGGMILHHWQPAVSPNDPVWGFSLLDQAGQPRPLLEALSARPRTSAAGVGLHPAANPFARYSGVWTFGPLGADIGWVGDSRLDFRFSGSRVGVLLRKDNYVGYLYPTIDGQSAQANALPRDAAGNPYIVLTSGSLTPEVVPVVVADGLGSDEHHLEAVADRGFDRWALAGYAVSPGDLSEPYHRQVALAAFTIGVAAIAALVTGAAVPWRALFKLPALRWTGLIWGSLSALVQLALSLMTTLALMAGMLLTWGEHGGGILRREPAQLLIAVISAGLVYLNPGFIITVLSGIVLFWMLYQRLIRGPMLALLFAPFFLFPVELYRFAFPMVEVITLLTFAAWALRGLAEWSRVRAAGGDEYPFQMPKPRALDLAVIAWVGLGGLSLLWAGQRDTAITELRALIVEPALFYLVLRTARPTRREWVALAGALIAAGVLVAAIGLFQFARGEAVITAEGAARRLASVYGSPNNVALFLGRCLPFALAIALNGSDIRRRVGLWVAIIVMLVALILTQSVGGLMIGLPAGLAAVLLAQYGRRAIPPLIVLAIIAGVGFALGVSVSDRFARALDFTQGTNLYRIRVWQSALYILADNPLTGLGLDQFLYAFRGTYIFPDAWQDPNLSHPHNILLDFWVRLGIGGVVLLAWFQIGFWREVGRGLRGSQTVRPGDPPFRALLIGAAGCMVNMLAHGLIDNSVFVLDLVYVFMFVLALAATLPNLTQSQA